MAPSFNVVTTSLRVGEWIGTLTPVNQDGECTFTQTTHLSIQVDSDIANGFLTRGLMVLTSLKLALTVGTQSFRVLIACLAVCKSQSRWPQSFVVGYSENRS